MSTPAGQSTAQPLQDRHRSSDSSTSADDQPPVTSPPLAISCNTLARPRVESFSSRVATYDGHITAFASTGTRRPRRTGGPRR